MAPMDLEEGATQGADPLIQDDMTNISESQAAALANAPQDMTVEQGKALTRQQRRWTRIVVTTAVACFGLALASMALSASAIIVVCFCIPVVTAPYVIYQRKMINRLPTMVHIINQTRHQVNRLTKQNGIFQKENDRLSNEVAELKQVEYKFHKVCESMGTNATELKELVDENGKIQKEMKKILDAQQLQDIFSAILRSDTNQDFQISEAEMDRLILRLKAYNVADQERLKDTLRAWTHKSEEMEWSKMLEEADGGTMTGVKGWVL